MNKKDERYFNLAKSISQTSDFKRINIGCVIVLNKDILASSANIKKSHPMQYKFNSLRFDDRHCTCKNYLHAEMNCLLKCKYINLSKASLYVYREDRNGNLANSRPCNACMEEIKRKGIGDIWYTTGDGYCHEVLNY
jgi:deoxycytidylate deaminase